MKMFFSSILICIITLHYNIINAQCAPDVTPPECLAQDITVYLDNTGNVMIAPADIDNGSNDFCTDVTTTIDISSFDCDNIGDNTVQLTVEDVAGNTSTCTSTVSVLDTIAPMCVSGTGFVDLFIDITVPLPARFVDEGSTDNCDDDLFFTITPGAFSCDDVGLNPVVFTAMDDSGNICTSDGVVWVREFIRPTCIVKDVTLEIGASGMVVATPDTIDNGTFDPCGIIENMVVTPNTFTCAELGVNTVTFMVSDTSGNTCSATAEVFVISDLVCNTMDATVSLDANGNGFLSVADVDNGTTDPCAAVDLTLSQTSFDCADIDISPIEVYLINNAGTAVADSCPVMITVVDMLAPICSVSDISVYLDAAGTASIDSSSVDAGSSDNCGSFTMDLDIVDFTCADIGDNTVTVTVSDGVNEVMCTSTVTVLDTIAPMCDVEDATVYLDATGNVMIDESQFDLGSDDNCGVTVSVVSPMSADCSDIGDLIVAYTIEDSSGNSTTCEVIVSVLDTIAPMCLVQDVTIQLDAMGVAVVDSALVDAGSSDNCDEIVLALSQMEYDCSEIGVNAITVTVTDDTGNTSECVSMVTVEDTMDPICSVSDITVYLDAAGTASIDSSSVDAGSSDNCGSFTMDLDIVDFTCVDIGDNTVTVTVSDGVNEVMCTSTVTVLDTIAPMCDVENATVYLDATGNVMIDESQFDLGSNDNCGVTVSVVSPMTADCSDIGDLMVAYTIEDSSGNSTTCEVIVSVLDTIAPMCLVQDVTIQLDAMGVAVVDSALVDAGSSDNCDEIILALSQIEFDCSEIGVNEVTVLVTDETGNTSECVSMVTVEDTMDPICSVSDITVFLDAAGTASIDSSSVDAGSSDNCGSFTMDLDIVDFTCVDIGDNTVTITVSDGVNEVMCTSIVTVLDTIAPMCDVEDATVYLDATGNVMIDESQFDLGSDDNCGVTVSVVSPMTADCSDIGDVTVAYTIEDSSGNSTICEVVVTVLDTIAPVCLVQDVTIQLDATGVAVVDSAMVDAGSSDNCDEIILALSQMEFDCSEIGLNEVTVTVTDETGNTSECVSMVTVEDTMDPICSVSDITVYLDAAGTASIDSSSVDAGSSDNCGSFTMDLDIVDFTCADIGDNTVTVTVSDGVNEVMCTSTVTVLDTIAPMCDVEDATVYLDATGNVMIDESQFDLGSDDNCGVTVSVVSPMSADCSDIGDLMVAYTIEDSSGNSTTCEVIVSVLDTISPVCVFNDLIIDLDENGLATIDSSMVDGGSSDNCGELTLVLSQEDFTCEDFGDNEVSVTLTDGSGNSKTGTIIVTVNDLSFPMLACPNDTLVECSSDLSNLDIFGMPEILTTCGGDVEIITTIIDSINACGLGFIERRFVATETGVVNSIDSCVQRIISYNPNPLTILDISFPDPVSLDECSADLDVTGEVIVDETNLNCSQIFIEYQDDTLNTSCPLIIDRNWVISDSCALPISVFEYTQSITIQDTMSPILTCPSKLIFSPEDGECEREIPLMAIASDNCTFLTVTNDSPYANASGADASGTYPIGTTVVTFTAVDACGNESQCETEVTINNVVELSCTLNDLVLQFPTSNTNETIEIDSSDLDLEIFTCLDIVTIELSETVFTCDQENQEITVIITDEEGNTTSCSAAVIITSSCINFNDATETTIQINDTDSEVIVLDVWSSSCASAGYALGGNGFSLDSLYLEIQNEMCMNNSYIYTNSLFNGNLGAYDTNVVLCYDLNIQQGENTLGAPISILNIFDGSSPASSTIIAEFVPTDIQFSTDGFQTICVPLVISVDGTLPSNADGMWQMSDPSLWNDLITMVGGISFNLDVVDGVEVYGVDNICITPETTTLPSLTCPKNLEIFCYEADDADFGDVEIGENCMMEYVLDTLTTANIDDCSTGNIIREFVIIDELGNSAMCTQEIVLLPPNEEFLTPPAALTIILEDDQCSDIVPVPAALLNEFACSDLIDFTTLVDDITINGNGGMTELPAGKYEATFIGMDECGNESQVTSQINLLRPCDLFVHTQLNLSVNDMCEGEVTAAMVATFPVVCDDYYTLILIDEAGDTIPSTIVNSEHIGQNIQFVLSEPNCGNKAWGNILVEDKLPPSIECFADTIACGELVDFPIPNILDACDNSTLVLIDETEEDISCEDDLMQTVITRNYKAVDINGNESQVCSQQLFIRKFDINTIEGPEFNIELECGEQYPIDENGAPDPYFFGGPTVEGNDIFADQGEECNLMTIFDDKFISTNQGDVIVREFNTFYWSCNVDTIIKFVQVFKFVDSKGPEITCLEDVTIASNADLCSADYQLPMIEANELCGVVAQIDIQLESAYIQDAEGQIINLEMGENLVTLIALDDSGNSSTCEYTVTVEDLTPPTPICDSETVIPLPQEGFIDVVAEAFDQASYDYCGISSFEVRRMNSTCQPSDINFGPSVRFCCEDIGNEVMVVLRVTDMNGNYNDCMVTAEVQDKIGPSLLAGLPDITVSCEFPITPDFPQVFGKVVSEYDDRDSILITADYVEFYGEPLDALVIDNCVEVVSDEIDTTSLNACGLGNMDRTIVIADAQGNDLVINQSITRININPFSEADITWPAYYNAVDICSIDNLKPEDLPDSSAYPILNNTFCDQVGWLYEDDIFDFSGGDEACFKIRRTWEVANWCQKDQYGNTEKFIYEQIIKVINTIGPEITGDCTDRSECFYNNDCSSEYIELINTASDECTDSINLLWNFGIDLDSDGTIEITGQSNNASDTYPLGVHTIYWQVQDQCGGVSNCSYVFELKNCKEPTAYCLDNITSDLTPMDLDGDGEIDTEMLFLYPYMIDAGSQGACGSDVSLSFSSDLSDTIRTYDCFDIGLNTVLLWVTDELGNQSYCTTSIDVQDNNTSDFCEEEVISSLEGNISTSAPIEMENVKVTINGIENTLSNSEGNYSFLNLNGGEIYTLAPSKEGQAIDGISVADILLIQRHILGLQPLEDPYKILAADVNQSESVNGTDILIIRKLLLGHYDDFPATDPWKFYMDEEFIDESWPWANTLHEEFEDIVFGQTMVDFVGVKMGDVNQTGSVNGFTNDEINTRNIVELYLEEALYTEGEKIEVPLVLGQAQKLDAYQWELKWNSDKAELINVQSNIDNIAFHYNYDPENGILRIISYSENSIDFNEDEILLTILAEAKENIRASELISTSKDPRFINEWISNLSEQSIKLKVNSKLEINEDFRFEISQNVPNPWDEMTTIQITSAIQSTAQISIMNSVGQVLYESKIGVSEGENELIIYPESLDGNGVYYYSVELNGQKRMKKMILLK